MTENEMFDQFLAVLNSINENLDRIASKVDSEEQRFSNGNYEIERALLKIYDLLEDRL